MMNLFNQLSHSAVLTSLLIVVVIVLFVIETFSPHTFGIVGLLATFILAGTLYAYQATGVGFWFGPILLSVGVALVMVEVLGVHFHGLLVMGGSAAIGCGMFYALGASTNAGISATAGVAASFCALFYTFKMLPLSPFWQQSGAGNVLKLHATPILGTIEIGTEGKASSDLRPCGMVMFDESPLPARSVSGLVRSGATVFVCEVRKHEVLVTIDRM